MANGRSGTVKNLPVDPLSCRTVWCVPGWGSAHTYRHRKKKSEPQTTWTREKHSRTHARTITESTLTATHTCTHPEVFGRAFFWVVQSRKPEPNRVSGRVTMTPDNTFSFTKGVLLGSGFSVFPYFFPLPSLYLYCTSLLSRV